MSPDQLSATFFAIADPTRRAIIARLASGESSVSELAGPFDMSLPAISKHLKVLERAGLIARGRDAKWRPCRLEAGPLKDVAEWLEHYRCFWDESVDRLGQYLEELQTKEMEVTELTDKTAEPGKDRVFKVERTFDVPRDIVWRAWTEPERLAQWWGPKGFEVTVARLDMHPGGTFLYRMRAPGGGEMWGKWVIREIVPPERLVFLVSFADEEGNISRHPLSETWPLEMLSTMTLAEHEGKTTLTITAVPHNATDVEEATFDAGREGMTQGFNGTLSQLEAYLAEEHR